MKNLITLLMALAMLISLVSCGSNSGSTDEPAVGEAAPTGESAPADETAPVDASGAYDGESFTIHMASSENENSDQNAPLVYFRDLVAEKSGGAVTVEVSWGGTEYDNSGIWEAMGTGLLDMDICLFLKHSADAPLMLFGFMPYSANAAESIEQTNYILFENETTSKIFTNYFADAGMTVLGNSADGAPSFITTFEWDTLDDLVSKCSAFGTMTTAKYLSLGLNTVAVTGGEAYDNLSRGIVDGVSMAVGTAVSNSLQEVASYCTIDGQYTSAVLLLANTDFWNGLSPEAQALVQECVDETSAFSASHVTEATEAAAHAWEEATGVAVKYLGEEEGKAFWAQTLAATAENAKANSAGQPYEEEMKTIVTEWIAYQEQYHGFDVDFEW